MQHDGGIDSYALGCASSLKLGPEMESRKMESFPNATPGGN
jgi:hypothetical protein